MPLRCIGLLCCVFFSDDIMFAYSKMYSGKSGGERCNYSIVILGLGMVLLLPWTQPAARFSLISGGFSGLHVWQLFLCLFDSRGLPQHPCLGRAQGEAVTFLAPGFGWPLWQHKQQWSPHFAASTATRHWQPWATSICLLSAVKQWHGVFWDGHRAPVGRAGHALLAAQVCSVELCNTDGERLLLTAHTPDWVWYPHAQCLPREAAHAQKEFAWELCCSLLLCVLSTGWCSR